MTQIPNPRDEWLIAFGYFKSVLFNRIGLREPKEDEVQPHIDAFRRNGLTDEQWEAATHGWSLRVGLNRESEAWQSTIVSKEVVELRKASITLQP